MPTNESAVRPQGQRSEDWGYLVSAQELVFGSKSRSCNSEKARWAIGTSLRQSCREKDQSRREKEIKGFRRSLWFCFQRRMHVPKHLLTHSFKDDTNFSLNEREEPVQHPWFSRNKILLSTCKNVPTYWESRRTHCDPGAHSAGTEGPSWGSPWRIRARVIWVWWLECRCLILPSKECLQPFVWVLSVCVMNTADASLLVSLWSPSSYCLFS